MKVYVAGPMTGIPQFNFPAFDEAAKTLRSMGHEVFSPAEMDDPETRRIAMLSPDGAPGSGSANGETWGDFLSRDVKLIADGGFDGVFVLPGWRRSRGARLETFVANALNRIPIYCYPCAVEGADSVVPDHALETAWSGRAIGRNHD